MFKKSKKLKEAEYALGKIAAGKPGDWQTTLALRYFGWTWDAEGHPVPPPGEEK